MMKEKEAKAMDDDARDGPLLSIDAHAFLPLTFFLSLPLSLALSLFARRTPTLLPGLHLRHPRSHQQGGRADARREGARQDQEKVCDGHGGHR